MHFCLANNYIASVEQDETTQSLLSCCNNNTLLSGEHNDVFVWQVA